MAGNWGAILAGLAGGAGALGTAMSDREKEATRKAELAQAAMRQLALDSLARKKALGEMGAVADTGNVTQGDVATGLMGSNLVLPTGLGTADAGMEGLSRALGGAKQTEREAERFELPNLTGGVDKLRIDEQATPEAKAMRRLTQQQRGQQQIEEAKARAAEARLNEQIESRYELANINNKAAQQRANTMADAQRGMVAGVTQTMEGNQPIVTAYTRGGESRKLGNAPPKAGAATKQETALAAGEAERSYMNLLDPRTQKIADPPGWVDRAASKTDAGNVIASDAGSAYMTNVRGLIRSWVVTVEGKRMSDADARVNELLKSFRFGGGPVQDEQTKARLEGMYRDIVRMARGNVTTPAFTPQLPTTPQDRKSKYRSPNG